MTELGIVKRNIVRADKAAVDKLGRFGVATVHEAMGRVGLINSGGASGGASDLAEAVRTAVINKRGGGLGLISGRKAFQRPRTEGVALLNAIQDVYLCPDITVA